MRSQLDERDDTIASKIRDAQMQKIPYILIVGEKEEKAETISVRSKNKDEGATKPEDLISQLEKEIKEKTN